MARHRPPEKHVKKVFVAAFGTVRAMGFAALPNDLARGVERAREFGRIWMRADSPIADFGYRERDLRLTPVQS